MLETQGIIKITRRPQADSRRGLGPVQYHGTGAGYARARCAGQGVRSRLRNRRARSRQPAGSCGPSGSGMGRREGILRPTSLRSMTDCASAATPASLRRRQRKQATWAAQARRAQDRPRASATGRAQAGRPRRAVVSGLAGPSGQGDLAGPASPRPDWPRVTRVNNPTKVRGGSSSLGYSTLIHELSTRHDGGF